MTKIKLGRAAAYDDLAPEMIKWGGQEMINILWDLFKKIWKEERIPKEWEYNIIIPIHKKGETSNCDNYRAICLSLVVLKIYTRILERKLREEVEEDFEEVEGAFRPGRQTQDSIFILRTIGEKLLAKNRKILLAFLDLKSAFDLVSRAEIWKTLMKKGITKKLIR